MIGEILFDFEGKDVYGVIFLGLSLVCLGVVIWALFFKR